MRIRLRVAALLLAGLVHAAPALAANPTRPGEFLVDPPTLINLGFEWFIDGDDNRNASVEVTYRKQGAREWMPALPLLRLQGEQIVNGLQLDVVAPNMFAGSILDLEPDTAYEARFVLADPDGVTGESQKTVTVRTRAEPMPYAGGDACSTCTRRDSRGRRPSRPSKV